GDRLITSVRDLTFAVAAHAPGERITVDIVRDGEARQLRVELGDRAEAGPAASRRLAPGSGERDDTALGLRLAPLTERERARLGLPPGVDGVLVAGVQPGSGAAPQLLVGDVILSVDGRSVASVEDATSALERARHD